ncbi:MAG: glycosyltransferase [bacterium]
MLGFAVLFPVKTINDSVRRSLATLKQQTLDDWICCLIDETSDGSPSAALAGELHDSRIRQAPSGLKTAALMINWALKNTDAEFILPLPERILLDPWALERFAALFMKSRKAAAAYACYLEMDDDGKSKPVHLFPHEGAPHERFDFGYVRVYRADRLREIGGFREELAFAAEYDVELKLCDKYTIGLVKKPLYTVEPAPSSPDTSPESAASSTLYSPGKGKLGGFSYVFYPPDLEAEITSVFQDMLRRRGAQIDHPTVAVKYPKRPYSVLASVVIPVLNRARFIGNAIERVLDGTFKDFEIIVVDNGSTDSTQDVVRGYIMRDARVRMIEQRGPSIAYALNCGIRAARGKYICQLDSDDEYTPGTLEKMMAHMESHPQCGLAISYYELMDEDRGKVEGVEPVTHKGYTRNQILRRDGAGALRVFPKAVLEEMGLYDEENYGNFGEDYDMVLKVGEKHDVDRVHAVLYRYRRHADNTDVTRDPVMKIRNKNNARLAALKRRQKINRKLKKS